MNNKILKIVLTAIILSILFAVMCDLPQQPGPMPKDIVDVEFEPGLNILGILRLTEIPGKSFIYIEEAKPVKHYNEEELLVIKDAYVKIWKAGSSEDFIFNIYEEVDNVRYINESFIPVGGETYNLRINANAQTGNLSLTAETTVPEIPEIDSLSFQFEEDVVSFDIITSRDASSYEVYLFFPATQITKSYHNTESKKLHVTFDIAASAGNLATIQIFAYDANLTEYLNSSSTLMPQVFQPTLSTVEDGYGCFGSISKKTIIPF